MAEGNPLFMDIDNVYSGDELALPYRDLITEGVLNTQGSNTDLKVTQRGAGANLSVDVAAGAAWVLGDTNTNLQPCYRVYNNGVVNLGISPDPTNPRLVRVVAQVTDEGFAGTGRNWALQAIHGTPAGSPSLPALPASALDLASISVTAADTDITNAQITDLRVHAGIGSSRLGQFRTYTPVWGSGGTAPAIGNGTLAGRYIRIGQLVVWQATITAGSTTTFGTNYYSLTLPVTALTNGYFSGTRAPVVDVSTGQAWSCFAQKTTDTVATALRDDGNLVSATSPIAAPATGDNWTFSGIYEAA